MSVARYDFACTELNGTIYAVGGHGIGGEGLSIAEFYDPQINKWTAIEPLRRPRWGCFGYSYQNKLFIMSGRSSFTIGNSKSVDVYNVETKKWCEIKNGCVMVTAHAVIGEKLFCLQWNKERKLSIYDPEANSWITVPIPLTGSSRVEFRFGVLDGKLLLFSQEQSWWYSTLVYEPEVKEWRTSGIKASGLCLSSVVIES